MHPEQRENEQVGAVIDGEADNHIDAGFDK